MANEENIKRYTEAEIEEMIARGEDRTNWERVRAKTDEEITRDIEGDPDWVGFPEPEDWPKYARLVMPGPKKLLSLRVDTEVVDWFKQQGPGYQTRMNAALKAYMTAHKKSA